MTLFANSYSLQDVVTFMDTYSHLDPAPDSTSTVQIPPALVIAIPIQVADGGPYTWACGVFGVFEIQTTYDPDNNTLTDTTVSVLIPGHGAAVAYQSGTATLDLDDLPEVTLEIPNASLSGSVTFMVDSDSSNVSIQWSVFLPWLGLRSESQCNLLPLTPPSDQVTDDVKAFTAKEIATLRKAPRSRPRQRLGRLMFASLATDE
ncbi:hypothetical protein H0H93_012468, partial [Arthromyces matolae]